MPPPWITLVNLLRNGEAVSAEVTNRPMQELGQRTEYLKALLDTLSIGQSIFDLDVAMSMDVQEGFAVYWDKAKQEYAPALAQLSYNAEGVYGGNADSAYVLGICAGKSSRTRGTVIFGGRAAGVDFSNAIEGGGALDAGPYFLSASEPGKMTKDRPPVGIYVMFGLNTGEAVVTPAAREVLDDHIHYKLPLTYGHIISGPSGGTGWTDVYDASKAPAGARFRYVVEEDPTVYALFPFYPTSAVYFDIDGIGGNSKVTIDLNGLWWTDVNHDPDEYNVMTVYYAKIALSTSNLLVRTLQAWTMDSPLKVVDCNGNAATAGDLYLKLDLQFEQTAENTPGWLAFKELTTSQQFMRGPIVQRVRSTSPELGLTINGTNGYDWGDGFLSGDLLITYNSPTGVSRSLDPTLTELNGALQEDYNGIPYIAMPSANYASGVSFRFDVPKIGLDGDFGLVFNVWLYSSAAGTFPDGGLGVDFTIVRAVTNLAAKQLSNPLDVILITDKTLTLYPNTTMNVNGYRTAACSDMDGIVVQPGDQVHVQITRNDAAYAGTVGVLKAWAEITQV
jgi:hypothetical protein